MIGWADGLACRHNNAPDRGRPQQVAHNADMPAKNRQIRCRRLPFPWSNIRVIERLQVVNRVQAIASFSSLTGPASSQDRHAVRMPSRAGLYGFRRPGSETPSPAVRRFEKPLRFFAWTDLRKTSRGKRFAVRRFSRRYITCLQCS